MPKLQLNGGKIMVNIPSEIVKLLELNKGDVVLFDANKQTDTITLRRVEKSE